MTQFHETRYGRMFFDCQIPALIKAVEDLSKTIKEVYSDYTKENIAEENPEYNWRKTSNISSSKIIRGEEDG